ncbi:MAG: hypothetical protein H7336_08780 [Bacteriovorax sp.]|nr:hypothetical protein [Bacteriovorax sp.]
MIRCLLVCSLLIFNLSSLQANDLLVDQLKTFNSKVQKAGALDYKENCSECGLSENQTDSLYTLYSALNKKSVKLSVLTEGRAIEVFNKLRSDEDIPFNYPLDGCYARAHKMAMNMDDMGIISGKAFIEGDLYVNTKLGEVGWSYHVASIVIVKKNGKMIPTVIDPALFNHPVSYNEWKTLLLKNPNSKMVSEYFTKRFNFDPDTRHADLLDYAEDDIESMNQINRSNGRLGEMLQMTQKLNAKGLK